VDDAFALGGIELVHAGEHAQGLVALDGLLLGIHLDGRADPALRKEPLRSGAGLSAVAVVAPVDRRHGVNLRSILSMGCSIQRNEAEAAREPRGYGRTSNVRSIHSGTAIATSSATVSTTQGQ